MGAYYFKKVALMWHLDKNNNKPVTATDKIDFPIGKYATHCAGHSSNHCNKNNAPVHKPVELSDHSFDLGATTALQKFQVAKSSRKIFALFKGKGTGNSQYSLGTVPHYSTTGGSGGSWVPASKHVSYQLLRGGKEVSNPDRSGEVLFLEMESYSIVSKVLTAVSVSTDEAREKLLYLPLSLGRTEEFELSFEQRRDPDAAGDQPPVELTPLAEDARLLRFSIPNTFTNPEIVGRLTVEFTGSPPTLVGPARLVEPDFDPPTPEQLYQQRKAEIDAASANQRDLAFFIDLDVQFLPELIQHWRPLTRREALDEHAGGGLWPARRQAMISRHQLNIPTIIGARARAKDEQQHGYLASSARAYGEPELWDESMYHAHLLELAEAQEHLVLAHWGSGPSLQDVDLPALDHAFQLFASGELRTKIPDLAFRNGEPDSGFMFFWAEFADELLRWLGPEGTDRLSSERAAFWDEFRWLLLTSTVHYYRNYRPKGEADLETYSYKTFREGHDLPDAVQLQRENLFPGWKKLLQHAFGAEQA